MPDPELNHWRRLTYLDPARTLLAYREVEIDLAMQLGLDSKVARLRTSSLKPEREARDAALFSHGMSARLGCPVVFAPVEESDYDFVTRTDIRDGSYFTPVQLKELVPEDLNPSANLDALLASLRKKKVFSNTALAIRLNRTLKQTNFTARQFIGLPFKEVWLFWAASPDSRRWKLLGDALTHALISEFKYPSIDGQ